MEITEFDKNVEKRSEETVYFLEEMASCDEKDYIEAVNQLNDGNLNYVKTLGSFTLKNSCRIRNVVSGFLLHSQKIMLAFSKNRLIEIVEINELSEKKINTVVSVKIRDIVCNMKVMPHYEKQQDVLVIVTKDRWLIILEYCSEVKAFKKIAYQVKSSILNLMGHFLITDPKGRAILLGGAGDSMILFARTRTYSQFSKMKITIPGCKIIDMISLHTIDDTFEFTILHSVWKEEVNPMQTISKYCLYNDNGLIEKYKLSEQQAQLLAPVKSSTNGAPEGIMVLGKYSVNYLPLSSQQSFSCNFKNHLFIQNVTSAVTPEILNDMSFVSFVPYKEKEFIFLAQTAKGDIIWIKLLVNEKNEAKGIKSVCIGNLPVGSTFCVINDLNTVGNQTKECAYIFITTELSSSFLYKINDFIFPEKYQELQSVYETRNFSLVAELPVIFPVKDFIIGDFIGRGCAQTYTVSASKPVPFLHVTEPGFKIEFHGCIEIDRKILLPLITHELKINGAWICENSPLEDGERIFISHENGTAHGVIDLDRKKIFLKKEDIKSFQPKEPSYLCTVFGKNGFLQISPYEINIYKSKHYNLKLPAAVSLASANQFNILFYVKKHSTLTYIQESNLPNDAPAKGTHFMNTIPFNENIVCLCVGQKRDFEKSPLICLAMDNGVISLWYYDFTSENEDFKMICEMKSMKVSSLQIVTLNWTEDDVHQQKIMSNSKEYLFIGDECGYLIIYELNGYETLNPETKEAYKIGKTLVKLFTINVQGCEAVIAQSNGRWLYVYEQSYWNMYPLQNDVYLGKIIAITPRSWNNNFLLITNNKIHLVKVKKSDEIKLSTPLYLTPRKIYPNFKWKQIIVLESDPVYYSCDGEKPNSSQPKQLLNLDENVDKHLWKKYVSCIQFVDPKKLHSQEMALLTTIKLEGNIKVLWLVYYDNLLKHSLKFMR